MKMQIQLFTSDTHLSRRRK